jgi:transmembrane sensor
MEPEPRNLARHLRPAADPEARERVWRGVAHKATPAPRRGPGRVVASATLVAAAAAALLWWTGSSAAPERLVNEAGAALRPAWVTSERPEATRLSDGSRVVVAAESVLEVVANDAQVFSTVVRRGEARFEVRPGGRRRWLVEAGAATVEVVGTVFVVERHGASTRVAVERGRVVVRGPSLPDGVAVLGAGQDTWVHPQADQASADPDALDTSTDAVDPPTIAPDTIEPDAFDTIGSARDPVLDPSVLAPSEAAAQGADEAPTAVRRTPSTEHSLDQRLRAADEARRAGRYEEARVQLLEVIFEAPSDARAPVAGFTLARIELDHFGATERAARRFREVADHPRAGALAPEALARAVAAFEQASETEAADEAKREYLRRFPDGRHAHRWRP